MKSPWKSLEPLEPGRQYLVLASSIPAKRRKSTARLFRGSALVRRQLTSADGIVGFSMLARPWAKQYATLSIWDDEGALDRFSRAGDHGRLMQQLAPDMGDTVFLRWMIDGSDGVPTWAEALQRLGASA